MQESSTQAARRATEILTHTNSHIAGRSAPSLRLLL